MFRRKQLDGGALGRGRLAQWLKLVDIVGGALETEIGNPRQARGLEGDGHSRTTLASFCDILFPSNHNLTKVNKFDVAPEGSKQLSNTHLWPGG